MESNSEKLSYFISYIAAYMLGSLLCMVIARGCVAYGSEVWVVSKQAKSVWAITDKPSKVLKVCPCSKDCVCGCNQGKECTCNRAVNVPIEPFTSQSCITGY